MSSRLMLVIALSLQASLAAAQTPRDALPPPGAPTGDSDAADADDSSEDEDEAQGPGKPGENANPAANATSVDKSSDITLEDWSRDDWMLIKPKVSLVDLDGYFRIGGNMLRRLDFGNMSVWEKDGRSGQLIPRYYEINDGEANSTYTNMRLRVEPRINITEQLQIVTTFDVFDNVILGSTPDSLIYGMTTTPVSILSRGQVPPRKNDNALTDSIVVKRVYGRVTALNEQLEVRFGRMADHWGLGMLYNSGDCLECNWSTNVDRLSLTFRALDHVFVPMIDWISKGPMHRPFGVLDPEPVDAVDWDDALQYGLRISREDHPEDIRDAVSHNHSVVNYGLSNTFRLQARDFNQSYYINPGSATNPGFDPTRDPNQPGNDERRDALIYTGDLYGRYYVGNLELAAEAAVTAGHFTDRLINPQNTNVQQTTVVKLGAAVEAKYHLRGDYRGVLLSLKAGGASGDSRDGVGALDQADTQRGLTPSGEDNALRNFQFSPDYHVDLLLFRRLYGTVTDAWYLRPEVAYRFDEKLIGRLAGIYSQAMFWQSTAGALQGANPAKPLGVEFDGELAYGLDQTSERGQFLAAIAAGILFPLGAFNNPTQPVDQQGGSFAWTIQARLALTF